MAAKLTGLGESGGDGRSVGSGDSEELPIRLAAAAAAMAAKLTGL